MNFGTSFGMTQYKFIRDYSWVSRFPRSSPNFDENYWTLMQILFLETPIIFKILSNNFFKAFSYFYILFIKCFSKL